MLKIASLVASLTIISKILGLARDLIVANYFGTSVMADAYNMAYLFTGNFFIVFGCIGGPFYSAVVSALPNVKSNRWLFIKSIIIKSTLALALITAVLYWVKPWLFALFINPNESKIYFDLTLFQFDWLMPLIVLCAPAGIIFAVLNAYHKYFEPSLSPAVVNIAMIAAVFIMGDAYSGLALALGTSVGALLSVLYQLPALYSLRPQLETESGISLEAASVTSMETAVSRTERLQIAKGDDRQYQEILIPALISTGIGQLIVFIDSFFCNGLEQGSWTALVIANRLVQLPLGVVLTSFLVPVFPMIAELAAQKRYTEMRAKVLKALGYILLLCAPAIVIGMIWTEPAIRLVFERGAFDARSTHLVSTAFFYLCISIVPYIFRDTLTRVFYSLGDSKTPLYVAIFAIFSKIILNYLLVGPYGLAGVAMATVLMTTINFLVLSVLLYFTMKRQEQGGAI